jgi:hypothetical protein
MRDLAGSTVMTICWCIDWAECILAGVMWGMVADVVSTTPMMPDPAAELTVGGFRQFECNGCQLSPSDDDQVNMLAFDMSIMHCGCFSEYKSARRGHIFPGADQRSP